MKILVAYDGSKVSENVLDLAHKHAKAFKAEICIVIVLKQSSKLEKEIIEKAEGKLKKIIPHFKANGIPCTSAAAVCFKSPGEELVEFAIDNDIDEIIIGIRKKSNLGKLIFGSTARYVILKAPCPVVTVK
ncbi:MAG: universal stress protein [Thermodesulfobacteriota bacterium]